MTHSKYFICFLLMLNFVTLRGQVDNSKPVNTNNKVEISISRFDTLLSKSIDLLSTSILSDISDSDHIIIIQVYNSLYVPFNHEYNNLIKSKRKVFLDLIDQKNYIKEIPKIYPDWIPSRGLGFYFKKLKIELGGTPHYFSYYFIVK